MLQQFSNNSSGKYSQIENWVEYTITSDMPIHQMSSELNHIFSQAMVSFIYKVIKILSKQTRRNYETQY